MTNHTVFISFFNFSDALEKTYVQYFSLLLASGAKSGKYDHRGRVTVILVISEFFLLLLYNGDKKLSSVRSIDNKNSAKFDKFMSI